MNKRIIIRRRKIANYIKNLDISPLKFYDYAKQEYISPKSEFDPSATSVVQMIIRALELSKTHFSVNSVSQVYETRASAWRSVLDIWRHIRYYYPTISLFEVMRNMHLVPELKGHYCPDVNRTVFKYDYPYGWADYNTRPSEFRIKFSTWKNL